MTVLLFLEPRAMMGKVQSHLLHLLIKVTPERETHSRGIGLRRKLKNVNMKCIFQGRLPVAIIR